MKTQCLTFALFLVLLGSCRENPEKKQPETLAAAPVGTLLEQLAGKHGFDHWKDVDRIRFTFNVDRDTSHFERSWIWDIRGDRVTRITDTDTVSYQRAEVDSLLAPVDGAFINDKYWLLAPYQWVWDRQNFTHEYEPAAVAPISGDSLARLTIVYGSEGGYTPGDAYDFFFGRDSVVREWIFRRGNQPEPSLATTWEGYETHGGLLLSTRHQNAEGSFRLYFTGISVE